MIYTNENWKPPVTYCEPNKVEVQRMNRQETADFLDKCRWWFEPYTDVPEKWHEAIDMAIEALRTGTWRWVDFWTEDRARTKHGIQCSECGECREWNDPYVFPSYCDECGAKMEGIENE